MSAPSSDTPRLDTLVLMTSPLVVLLGGTILAAALTSSTSPESPIYDFLLELSLLAVTIFPLIALGARLKPDTRVLIWAQTVGGVAAAISAFWYVYLAISGINSIRSDPTIRCGMPIMAAFCWLLFGGLVLMGVLAVLGRYLLVVRGAKCRLTSVST